MRFFVSGVILAALSTGVGCRNYGDFIAEDPVAEGRIKMDWRLVERLAKEGRSRYANR